MELMAGRDFWSGTPTTLMNELAEIAGDRQARSKAWPQSLKGLNNIIKRLTPSFRKIFIEIGKKESNHREYVIENLLFQHDEKTSDTVSEKNMPNWMK